MKYDQSTIDAIVTLINDNWIGEGMPWNDGVTHLRDEIAALGGDEPKMENYSSANYGARGSRVEFLPTGEDLDASDLDLAYFQAQLLLGMRLPKSHFRNDKNE